MVNPNQRAFERGTPRTAAINWNALAEAIQEENRIVDAHAVRGRKTPPHLNSPVFICRGQLSSGAVEKIVRALGAVKMRGDARGGIHWYFVQKALVTADEYARIRKLVAEARKPRSGSGAIEAELAPEQAAAEGALYALSQMKPSRRKAPKQWRGRQKKRERAPEYEDES